MPSIAASVLFVLSGLGNGSTYKMIPAVFRSRAGEAGGRRLSGAVIGIGGAVGALGGVLVNVAFRQSFLTTGEGTAAYLGFLGFYVVCLAVTCVAYLRPAALPEPQRPELSDRS